MHKLGPLGVNQKLHQALTVIATEVEERAVTAAELQTKLDRIALACRHSFRVGRCHRRRACMRGLRPFERGALACIRPLGRRAMNFAGLLHDIICGGLAAAGFGVLFNVSYRALPWCMASGAFALAPIHYFHAPPRRDATFGPPFFAT